VSNQEESMSEKVLGLSLIQLSCQHHKVWRTVYTVNRRIYLYELSVFKRSFF
jgi:hypothetical protein